MRQFNFVFLNDSATNLLMDCLSSRAQVAIYEFHASALSKGLCWRSMAGTNSEAVPVIQHVQILAVHLACCGPICVPYTALILHVKIVCLILEAAT